MLNVTTSPECLVTRHYLSPLYVGRSSIRRAPTVTAVDEGSSPFDPPKLIADQKGTVAER